MANKESSSEVGFAISFPIPGITDDGVPVVKKQIIASDFETGVNVARYIELVRGEAVERGIGVLNVEGAGRSVRSGTSFSGAFESLDPKASSWQPTGPKTPGKRRLN